MPMMRRSCISTVSCLGLTRGGAAPPYLTPQSASVLPLHNPHSSSRGGPLSHPPLFPCFPSQSPNSPHIRGSPELWGSAAGCSSVCQGAGCEKRHTGEEPWNRQARHPGSFVRWEAPPPPPPSPLLKPLLHPTPSLSCKPTSTPCPAPISGGPASTQSPPCPGSAPSTSSWTSVHQGPGKEVAEESVTLPSYPLPVPKVRILSIQALSELALQTATGRSLVPGLQGTMGRGLCKLGDQMYLSSSPGSTTDQLCDQGYVPFLL